MPAPDETVQVDVYTLPKLPERYEYTGYTNREGTIIQVRHVSSGHEMYQAIFGFTSDYDKTVAVLDSIISQVAPVALREELAKIGKTFTPIGQVIDLPPEARPLRADASDGNPE